MRDIRIEKDAEWLKLEGRVGQLSGTLEDARAVLRFHAQKVIQAQLGLVPGETIVERGGARFLVSRIKTSHFNPWVYGMKIKKDGTPSAVEQCLYTDWQKAG